VLAVSHPLLERERQRDHALEQARESYVKDAMTVEDLETAVERIYRGVGDWWRGIGPWRPA